MAGAAALCLLLAALAFRAALDRHVDRRYAFAPVVPAVPADGAAVARGRHLAVAIAACVACHGDDFGGRAVVDNAVFGHIYAPNLTRGAGGIGRSFTAADWARAIRDGVGPDGRGLVVMPSDEYEHLSDADLGALIAFLQRLPPVSHALPPTRLGPLAAGLIVLGRARMIAAETMRHPVPATGAPAPGDTVALGRYLATVGGCAGCHGPGLAGQRVPGAPPGTPAASDLTRSGIGASWTEAQFAGALRTGVRPDGTPINPFMPWKYAGQMSDGEIAAIWAYARTLPPAHR